MAAQDLHDEESRILLHVLVHCLSIHLPPIGQNGNSET